MMTKVQQTPTKFDSFDSLRFITRVHNVCFYYHQSNILYAESNESVNQYYNFTLFNEVNSYKLKYLKKTYRKFEQDSDSLIPLLK